MALLSQSLSLLRFSQAKRRTPLEHPFYRTTTSIKRSHDLSICFASSNPSNNSTQLPILPMPLVLFPGSALYHYTKSKDRVMMNNLLQTDTDRRFGVLFSDPNPTDPDSASVEVEIGCVAQVVNHQRLRDDRFFLICKGQERFRISDILQTEPYMVASVNWLEDRPPPDPTQGDDMEKLASEVEDYMKDVMRISNRLEGMKQDNEKVDVDIRKGQFPTPFSFNVASYFNDSPTEQQMLLELEDTATRLKRERDTLKNILTQATYWFSRLS
ncbi:uncharacterized protein LOC144554807 [Carex rostrata]